jgi:bifunctional UDP-N-acetylglucosamine pyrophosphorylase/glucosamine-1-phosphate N-acetyltransferase
LETHSLAAIVLAAGKSKRFRSATSKLIHPLAGRPLIHWTLSCLRGLGTSPIVVVVGADADAVRAGCGTDVIFAHQAEQRGTGHATLAAQAAFTNGSGLVIVLYGDLPLLEPASLARMVATHRDTHADLTLLTATVADAHGWGRIVRQREHVSAIVEDRDATPEIKAIREVNVGIYCLESALLFRLLGRVRDDNAQREIYLTDIVGLAVADGLRISDVSIGADEVAQVNSRAELAAIEQIVRRRTNAKWMAAGVTLEDPDNTYIDVDVEIGADTVIGPNVHLRGKTVIGERCRFDGNAFVTNTTIGNDVHVKFAVVMTESTVGHACEIGPFAQLRPRTRLANDVHIGDFVETKNAIIAQRTKANHLAYLGDVEIGEDTNIGAGTITCNYDGVAKYRTVIGARVQVGSDSQLIAPVTLADDSYVATGTTVRDDVPAGTLVFNRKDQVHRAGWVQAFRGRQNTTDGFDGPRGRGSKPRKDTRTPRGGHVKKATAARIKGKTRGKRGRRR